MVIGIAALQFKRLNDGQDLRVRVKPHALGVDWEHVSRLLFKKYRRTEAHSPNYTSKDHDHV